MSNKPKLDGSCMYCGGHIQYDDVAYSMICPLCGSYLKIAEFEREQNRLKEAQQQRDEAERRYEQADMTRKDAEERLKFTLLNLEKITDSQLSEQEATERILSEQKNGNRQLDVIRLNQQEIRDLVVSVRNGQTYENDQLDGLQRSQNAIQ